MRNLVHDTTYRRLRRGLLDAAHRLDDRLARIGQRRRRILFEAASPVSVAIFKPVFDRLRADEQLEFWFTSSDDTWTGEALFGSSGMPGRVVQPREARYAKFDLYVNTDFWNMTWLRRRCRRVHLFHGVAGKYDLDAPVRLAPTVATFDRLLFPNADRLGRYVDAGLVDREGGAAALVGYPKVDCLVDGSLDRREILTSLGLAVDRPTILYAPTWSPFSSLNRMGDAIIRTLARRDANVIVKLHDRSYDASVRASGGIDWRSHLTRLARECRIHIATGADASPYLFVADALVSDHSSVAFEYMLLDRPVIVMSCPDLAVNARINPQKLALLRDAAETVDDAGQLHRTIGEVLADPRRRSVQRRAAARDLFFDPGRAGARAAAVLYDVLFLPQPARLAAEIAVGPTSSLTAWKPELQN